MPKRGENIRKRKDGRWEGRFILSYTADGKAQYKSVYAKTYTEVKKQMKIYIENKDTAEKIPNEKTVEEVCKEWLSKTKIKLKQSSYAIYHSMIYSHIIPYFKNYKIKLLNNEVMERYIEEKAQNGRLDKTGDLSSKTIHDINSILIQVIKYAEKNKYIKSFNYDIALPKIQDETYPVLNILEQEKLIRYIKQNITNENLGVLIALYTGIRLGELCSLTWNDINFETEILSVTKTIQRIKNIDDTEHGKTKIIIDKPKSKKSIRDIPLPKSLLNICKIFYNKQNADTYILTGTAKYIEPRTYQAKFKKYLRKANIRDIKFHTVRHTFATRAIELNFDVKTLSELLGHSSVRFTLDRYVHSSNLLKKENMEKMANCL